MCTWLWHDTDRAHQTPYFYNLLQQLLCRVVPQERPKGSMGSPSRVPKRFPCDLPQKRPKGNMAFAWPQSLLLYLLFITYLLLIFYARCVSFPKVFLLHLFWCRVRVLHQNACFLLFAYTGCVSFTKNGTDLGPAFTLPPYIQGQVLVIMFEIVHMHICTYVLSCAK
jgi:hypothetical protein